MLTLLLPGPGPLTVCSCADSAQHCQLKKCTLCWICTVQIPLLGPRPLITCIYWHDICMLPLALNWYIYVCTHAAVLEWICLYVNTCICVHTCTYPSALCVYLYMYVHRYMCTDTWYTHNADGYVHVCVYLCTHVSVYIHVHTHLRYVYICLESPMCVSMWIHEYTKANRYIRVFT